MAAGVPPQPAAQHSVPGSPGGRGPCQQPGRFQQRHAQLQHPRQGQGHPVGIYPQQQQWYDQSGHEWWGGYYPDPGEWEQAWYGPGYGDPHPAGDDMHSDPRSTGQSWLAPLLCLLSEERAGCCRMLLPLDQSSGVTVLHASTTAAVMCQDRPIADLPASCCPAVHSTHIAVHYSWIVKTCPLGCKRLPEPSQS